MRWLDVDGDDSSPTLGSFRKAVLLIFVAEKDPEDVSAHTLAAGLAAGLQGGPARMPDNCIGSNLSCIIMCDIENANSSSMFANGVWQLIAYLERAEAWPGTELA
jgi:hypothetical protein